MKRARPRHESPRRRLGTFARVRAVLAGALVLGVGATATLAAWNDSEYARSDITAGTFVLESLVRDGSWTSTSAGSPVTLPLNATGLYPGQSRAEWMQIRTTSGSVPGSVSLSGVTLATSPNNPAVDPHKALGDALQVRIGTVASTNACTESFTGGSVVTGIGNLPSGLAPVPLSGNAENAAIYCVVVTLPTSAPNTAQGGGVTPTWEFTGTTPSG